MSPFEDDPMAPEFVTVIDEAIKQAGFERIRLSCTMCGQSYAFLGTPEEIANFRRPCTSCGGHLVRGDN